jgi:hypothetical protein
VLPMLMTALCDNYKWLTHEEFLTGLGIAQAMPGITHFRQFFRRHFYYCAALSSLYRCA